MSPWPYPPDRRLIVSLQSASALFDQLLYSHSLEQQFKMAFIQYLVGAYFVSKENWETDNQVDVARAYLRDVTQLSDDQVTYVQSAISDEIARCFIGVITDFGGNAHVGKSFQLLSDSAVIIHVGYATGGSGVS